MKKLPLILTAFVAALFFYACRHKEQKPEQNIEYQHYLHYKDIYNAYGKAPSDTTQKQLEDFLKEFPADARAWTFYARFLYNQNKVDAALAAYRKAIENNPRYTESYSGAGAIFNTKDNNDSAAYYLNKAVELHDSSAYTFLNLSMLYMKLKEKEKSLAFADSAFVKQDSSAAVCAGLGFIYSELKEKNKSAQLVQMAKTYGLKDTASFVDVLNKKLRIEQYYRLNNY